MKWAIKILGGLAIGFFSGLLGYGIETWQFWAFAFPLCVILGIIINW